MMVFTQIFYMMAYFQEKESRSYESSQRLDFKLIALFSLNFSGQSELQSQKGIKEKSNELYLLMWGAAVQLMTVFRGYLLQFIL